MSTVNEKVTNWLKSAEKPSLYNSTNRHNYANPSVSTPNENLERKSKIKDAISNNARDRRRSRKSIQTLNSSTLPISDFMMVKEDISSQRKSKFTSINGKIEDKGGKTSSVTSNSSNTSNNENTNIDNASDAVENEVFHSSAKIKSHNRQRRKSFLTGKIDSSFAASPCLPRRLEMDEQCFFTSSSPKNHTNITAKDISGQENYNHRQRKQASNQAIERDKQDLTRILSKGSDMSLTLQESQDTDSEPMFTQVFTQVAKDTAEKSQERDSDPMFTQALSDNEVEMEDADNMFSEALTQTYSGFGKKEENCSDDLESMFSQRETQLPSNSNDTDTNFRLPKNTKQLPLTNKNCRISKTNMTLHKSNTKISLTPIIETSDNTYQQPSFQNFSSGSLKTAIECLEAGLDAKNTSQTRKTDPASFPIAHPNRDQAIGSSEHSSEIGEPPPLDIDEEEELAVSIMTQAFSEHLSAEQSPGAKLSHPDTEEANEDMPCTQPSFKFILEGVVAYVEVRTGNENRSACVKNRLESLGAKVLETLNTNCTHLVFKDGSLSSYNKAKKFGLHIVSVSWIEACRNDSSRLPEASFPCSNRERYEAPGLFPKLRKAKSMQPKPEEDFIRALDMKINRREKAKQRTEEKAKAAEKAEKDRLYNPFTYRVRHPFPDHYYNSPTGRANLSSKNDIGSRLNVLDRLKEYDSCFTADNVMSPTFIEFISPSNRNSIVCNKSENEGKLHVPETPSPCKSDDLNTPLFNRIAERIKRKNSNSQGARIKPNNVHSSRHEEFLSLANQNLNLSHSKNSDMQSKENDSCHRETTARYDEDNCSSNPSPIVRKSFFDVNTSSDEPRKSVTDMASDEHANNKNYIRINEQGLVRQTELDCPNSIIRTRSDIKNTPKKGYFKKASNVQDTEKKKLYTKDQSKRQIENKPIIDSTTARSSPLSAPKSIVRTRSSIKNPSRVQVPVIAKEKDVNGKRKSPQSNKKDLQKKRRILFSGRSSLLAESPTGLTQEIEWKIPSPPKNIATKGRKSVAPLMTAKSTTKIVRSTSGSLLYAEPPKSNVINNKRQPRRSQVNSRAIKSTKVTVEENPDGSYEQGLLDYSGYYKVNTRQNKTDIKRTILPPRRSTAEFQSPLGPVTRRMSSTKINLVPIAEEIAFTSCNKEDIDLAKQLAKLYGPTEETDSQVSTQSSNSSGSRVIKCKPKPRTIKIAASGKVSDTTTHVVCGNSTDKTVSSQLSNNSQNIEHPKVRRTINILKGILHGCWILSVNWLYDSVELGYWAEEEMYELVDFSPAVRNMRLEKEAFSSPSYGLRFCSDLFASCRAGGPAGLIYVSPGTTPAKSELEELIRLGQGKVTQTLRVASIVVGKQLRSRARQNDRGYRLKADEKGDRKLNSIKPDVYEDFSSQDSDIITTWCVNEKWILDSVQFHALLPFIDYQL